MSEGQTEKRRAREEENGLTVVDPVVEWRSAYSRF